MFLVLCNLMQNSLQLLEVRKITPLDFEQRWRLPREDKETCLDLLEEMNWTNWFKLLLLDLVTTGFSIYLRIEFLMIRAQSYPDTGRFKNTQDKEMEKLNTIIFIKLSSHKKYICSKKTKVSPVALHIITVHSSNYWLRYI